MNEKILGEVSTPLFGEEPLAPGDRVPDFFLPDVAGDIKLFYVEARGKPIVVFLAAKLDEAKHQNQLREFERFRMPGEEVPAHCFAISRRPGELGTLSENFPGSILIDGGKVATDAFRVRWDALGEGSRTFVLDSNQRILTVFDEHCEAPARAAFDYVQSLRQFSESLQPRHVAPVVMIPRVFEPEFCRRLIDAYHERGSRETGIVTVTDGLTDRRIEHAMKKRFDYIVEDSELLTEIHWRFARRVIPEILKACCYKVTEAEGFLVACYRSLERGYFRTHRDNDSPRVAYRRFAVSLNLNTGEYEGGGLRFPEYGEHIYKPEIGEAIIFSCSFLHEAMDVTEGDRYVLLGFLMGDDGVRERAIVHSQMANGLGDDVL